MGFYAEHLLPRLVDWGMGREQFRVLRPRVLEGVLCQNSAFFEIGHKSAT